jgi:hypothetical protein
MLGLARWAGAGSSYRTIQRVDYTATPWTPVFWQFFGTVSLVHEISKKCTHTG